jgi:hypothetical protein
VEDVNDMKGIKAGIDQIKDKYPNFVDFAAHEVFRPVNAKSVADPVPVMKFWNKSGKERVPLMEKRKKGRQVHGATSQTCSARDLEFQVRSRRTDLRRNRGNY